MKRKRIGESVTAKEFLKQLEGDATYQAKARQSERDRIARQAALSEAALPLLRSLRAEGVEVRSVVDLVNASSFSPGAVRVLLNALQDDGLPPLIRESVAWALATPEARGQWDALVKAFQREQAHFVRSAIGSTLARLADRSVMGALLTLLHDKRCGTSRATLLEPFVKDRLWRKELEGLRDDPDLAASIELGLTTGTTLREE